MFCLYFCEGPVRNLADARRSDQAAFSRYFHACLERGVYFAPSQFEAGFLSLAHTQADIEQSAQVAAEALKSCRILSREPPDSGCARRSFGPRAILPTGQVIGAFRTGIAVNHRVRTRAKFFFQSDHKFFLKGVTYGTFAPDADGFYVGTPEKAWCRLLHDAGSRSQRGARLPRSAEMVPGLRL